MRLVGRDIECEALDKLLAEVLAGRSGVLAIRGQPGAGKSALLHHLVGRAADWQVATAVGLEAETELAFSGLHQLCLPILGHLERLPDPQRLALESVFGLSTRPAADRFLIGLATLTLLREAADRQPLICLVDDAQWLDGASAQITSFVARRLLAERIAIVCAVRDGAEQGDRVLAGLPELSLAGLGDADARSLLLANLHGPLDAAVCDQIVTESHGNPGALLELSRTRTVADLAGGFGLPDSEPVSGEIEQSFARRLLELPADTRLLTLTAATEPQGDPRLLAAASHVLGITMAAADPAVNAGLLAVGHHVAFAHPLVRSAAYRSASREDRQRVHRALAVVTDPKTDPDRRAWHRARATGSPDEGVATELERSAGRAQARGGVAAAAAFLQRAVALSADPSLLVERALAAAQASLQGGAFSAALDLTSTAEAGILDEFQQARANIVRGQVAFASGSRGDAPQFLLATARQLEPFDAELARETCLDAWGAALVAGRLATVSDLLEVSRIAKAMPPPRRPRPCDLLLEGLATLVTDGLAAAAPALRAAVSAVETDSAEGDLCQGWLMVVASNVLWDEELSQAINERQLRRARELGSLARLPIDLAMLSLMQASRGELARAASAIAEAQSIAQAIDARLAPDSAVVLAALRGREPEAVSLIESTITEARAVGQGITVQCAQWASAILCNGACRYEEALAAAQAASDDDAGPFLSSRALPELIEAAVKSRHPELARGPFERLAEVTGAAGSDSALGMHARCGALLAEGAEADELYREAVDRLGRTRLRPELARAHLVYGEWLRREASRLEARRELRSAHAMFAEIGMEAFAERARRELNATGEKARKRSPETRDHLTPQEEQIARLAADGLSNHEIGAQLFISDRTVEWHLRKVFAKLGISSRRQLRRASSASTSTRIVMARSAADPRRSSLELSYR